MTTPRRPLRSAGIFGSPKVGSARASRPDRKPRPARIFGRMLAASLAVATLATLALGADPALAQTSLTSQPGVSAQTSLVAADAAHTAARAATPATASGVKLDLTAGDLGTITAGKDVTASVTLTNVSPLPSMTGSITIYLSGTALADRTALDAWLNPVDESVAAPLGRSIATVPSAAISSGVSTFSVTIPAASLKLPGSGVYGLTAEFTAGSKILAQGRASIVAPAETVQPVGLALALPLTVPAGTEGILPSALLETYTGPTGVLTRKLDAAMRRPVAIAIDPMILASIRVLGNSAPASARNWLARLQSAPNEVFALSYADSDIAVQAQAGIPLLKPTSFDYAVDQSLFSKTTPTQPITPTPGTPSPTNSMGTPAAPTESEPPSTGGLPTAPTLESLTAWPYTATGIGWPAERTVTKKDLAAFEKSGISTTILSGSNVTGSDKTGTPGAHATVSGQSALVADSGVTSALLATVSAQSERDWSHAMSELSAQLALISQDGSDATRTLLATLDRNVDGLGRLGQTVDALTALPWVRPATLNQALAVPAAVDTYTIKDQPESATRVAAVTELHARASQIADLATVIKRPELMTGRYRADVLALLATSWIANPTGFAAELENSLTASSDLLDDVRLGPMSDVQLLGRKAPIPITVINDLPYAATVRVQTTPLNGRLTVDDDVTAVIEARSQSKVLVPVTARVANGEVTLRVTLFNDDMSVTLDTPDYVPVNVRADWETFGTLILAVLIVGFFGFGLWRNISRRRRAADAAGPTLSSGDETDPRRGETHD